MALKKRQKYILSALAELGGKATTRQIAEKANLNVNGVAQSLGVLTQVICLGGRGGETQWQLKEKSSSLPRIGDDIYIPTFADEHNTYLVGGLARIVEIIEGQFIFEGLNINFRWENGLDAMQEDLKKKFGNKRAYRTGIIPPCPLK